MGSLTLAERAAGAARRCPAKSRGKGEWTLGISRLGRAFAEETLVAILKKGPSSAGKPRRLGLPGWAMDAKKSLDSP